MAAYEDWIPLDNEIFNKLDTCDPSFSWELIKNEVIKEFSIFCLVTHFGREKNK